jgi:predicted RNase H-like nuclease
MKVVLGVDAAWTAGGSSGVALLRVEDTRRKVLRVASSYDDFIEAGHQSAERTKCSGPIKVRQLLDAAQRRAGAPVDVVAVDMPMSVRPIIGSRTADRKIASAFGSMNASPYTPKRDFPGEYGKHVSDAFNHAGYVLATSAHKATRSLIEVFPLAALACLLRERPTYKSAKTSKYWKQVVDRGERMKLLLAMWGRLGTALGGEIGDLGFALPTNAATFSSLKPFEDMLDAVICAWVGACYVQGRAEAYGDDDAAIWVPRLEG